MTDVVFEADRPWQLHPKVALRPETFGALAYHYETRRLAFLKSAGLVEVVKALGEHESAAAAVAAHTSSAQQHERYTKALAHLAGLGIISPRGDDPRPDEPQAHQR